MTMTLDHCLICYRGGVTVTGGGNSGSLPENGNTCGRPFKVIRHYLTLNSDHFNPEEIANTKQQLFEEQVCDVCSPLVTSFSELYGQWRRLQLEMNLKLEQMEDMMVKADDEANIEFSSYRKCFQEKLMQSSITLENFTGFRDDLKRKGNAIPESSRRKGKRISHEFSYLHHMPQLIYRTANFNNFRYAPYVFIHVRICESMDCALFCLHMF